MVTVEDAADVAAFKDFTPDASPAAASSKPAAAVEPPKAASESLKSVQVNASPAAQVAHGVRNPQLSYLIFLSISFILNTLPFS